MEPVYSGFCRMLSLLQGSWDMFASHSGLSWTSPANESGGKEGGALGEPTGPGCGAWGVGTFG